jgi:PIN domain nuclease of toxin-antitoxin system
LDTNVLFFILHNDQDNIHYDVRNIVVDYANTLLVSSVVVGELLFLFRIGKFIPKSPYKNEQSILTAIADLGIKTVFFNENHFAEYTKLTVRDDHKDMNDHLIISQAISDKITLISSDNQFPHYENQRLKFVFNKR